MLVCVPLPFARRERKVIVELSGDDSSAAWGLSAAFSGESLPRSWLTSAAAFFEDAESANHSGGIVSLPMAKW